ncbi:DUF6428 family protein [Flavobacterium rhizosphaerae]|uniref:DUF6428 family protein n=1 Tax=Flavobacterium rhizosphaerae TaxID=3163298 RepID=A0ABW8YZJ2_9FLAO
MRLSEVKESLAKVEKIRFRLEDGTYVPSHFHITELGVINRHFVDCGGTVRTERKINFQLWTADDFSHRLEPYKVLNIISLSEILLGTNDDEVEVEYQAGTIGKFSLDFDGEDFILVNTHTNCLGTDKCGVSVKPKVKLSQLANYCVPGSGCC